MNHRLLRWLQNAVVIAVVGLGFGVRLWWANEIAPRQVADARTYANMALQLAAGEGYQDGGRPSAYYPIGYPLALSAVHRLFGPDPLVARVANAVISIVTLLALFVVARAVTNSRLAALLGLLAFALYPADVGFTAVTLSQAPFNALALLGCALCLRQLWPRSGSLVLGGALLGAATLTRHQGAVLAMLIVLGFVLRPRSRRRVRQAALVSAAFIVTLLPWTIRNAVALGGFVPVATNGGINLYIGNNPRANGHYVFTPELIAPLMAAIDGPRRGGPNEVVVDRLATRLAWQWASQQPAAALALWRPKLHHLYKDDSAAASWQRKLPDEAQASKVRRLDALNAEYYVWLLRLGVIGACIAAVESCRRRNRLNSWLWLPAAVIAGFTALHLLTFGEVSYHHPMMPWFAIYAGYAVASVWRYGRSLARAEKITPCRASRSRPSWLGPLARSFGPRENRPLATRTRPGPARRS